MNVFDVRKREICSYEDFIKSPDAAAKPVTIESAESKKNDLNKAFTRIKKHPLFNHEVFSKNYEVFGIKECKNFNEYFKKEKAV
jgi:hypothetical protein